MKLEPMILLHVDFFGVVVGATEKIGDPAAVQSTIHEIVKNNPTISKVKVYLKTDPNCLAFHSVWRIRKAETDHFSDLIECIAPGSSVPELPCTE